MRGLVLGVPGCVRLCPPLPWGLNIKAARFACCIFMVFLCSGIAFGLSGGGVEGDPWVIESLADLDEFAWDCHIDGYLGGYVRIDVDIYLTGRTYTSAVIAPTSDSPPGACTGGAPFTGVFDGNGHKIINLTIDTAGADYNYLGLFGRVDGSSAVVKNLVLENVKIIGGDNSSNLGGLCGENGGTIDNCSATCSLSSGNYQEQLGGLCGSNLGTITNCYATGMVSGIGEYFGGLCGENGGTISNCYSAVSVSGISDHGGGLCGANSGTITNCSASGSVTGYGYLGGLCGVNRGIISYCHAIGAVQGKIGSGGLCGRNYYGTISNCYSTGSVTGRHFSSELGGLCGENRGSVNNCFAIGYVKGGVASSSLGGLCGLNSNNGKIRNSYATGSVAGGGNSEYLGGFCGESHSSFADILNCFWDVEASGIGLGGDDNFGAVGKTTEEMMTLSTFVGAGWDFVGEDGNGSDDVWRMCVDGDGYPRLGWEYSSFGDFACGDGVDFGDLVYLCDRWLVGGEFGFAEFGVLAENWVVK